MRYSLCCKLKDINHLHRHLKQPEYVFIQDFLFVKQKNSSRSRDKDDFNDFSTFIPIVKTAGSVNFIRFDTFSVSFLEFY